jgi:hypothetical protein
MIVGAVAASTFWSVQAETHKADLGTVPACGLRGVSSGRFHHGAEWRLAQAKMGLMAPPQGCWKPGGLRSAREMGRRGGRKDRRPAGRTGAHGCNSGFLWVAQCGAHCLMMEDDYRERSCNLGEIG